MREQDITFTSQQTLIACRAFFPDSENTFSGVLCCKDGQPVVYVELNYAWEYKVRHFYNDFLPENIKEHITAP